MQFSCILFGARMLGKVTVGSLLGGKQLMTVIPPFSGFMSQDLITHNLI